MTGVGRVIPGWDLMIQEMKLGEKRTVIIPWWLAYGAAGRPPGDSAEGVARVRNRAARFPLERFQKKCSRERPASGRTIRSLALAATFAFSATVQFKPL